MTRWFLDTEFNENGRTIELISIALVSDDGREFYAVSSEFDPQTCNDWVKQHVLPRLPRQETWVSRAEIAEALRTLLLTDPPEIWAYYADYDWVAFCQLFGRMIDLPKGLPMWCRDIKQLAWSLGDPKLPEQGAGEHDALEDARWNLRVYRFLGALKGRKG